MNEQRKIMHFRNICRVPMYIAKAQREYLRDNSQVFAYDNNPYDIGADIMMPMNPTNALGYLKLFRTFRHYSKDCDTLHFHIKSILPKCQDLLYWGNLTKKNIIVHHHGSEIRNKGEFDLVEKYADRIIVSTPDLLDWSKNAIWIPNAIDVSQFDYVGVPEKKSGDEIKVIHAPINREMKGTVHIINAIEELKKEGCNISLTCVEGISPLKVQEIYKTADIIVDQVMPNIGSYGMFSIESMLLGKPVVCSINENLREKYFAGIPISNVNIYNLKDTLKSLYDDYELRKRIGVMGRHYAKMVHDSNIISEKINKVYEGY